MVGPLLKDTLNKGHNTFNLSIKDKFCGSSHPDYPGQPGHILSESAGSDLLYKISGSDPDSA